jgi:polyphosphate kinase 2
MTTTRDNGAAPISDTTLTPGPTDALSDAVVESVATALERSLGRKEALSPATIKAVLEVLADEGDTLVPEQVVLADELTDLHTSRDFIQLLRSKGVAAKKIRRALDYERDLERLQIELVKLQRWVQAEGRRVAILFEGRDAAGKGGTIRRFTEHMNPRALRVVALPKPTEDEAGQWYFQRYMRQLPNRGEIVFFDRSWYNRAVVEPVNSFCTADEYERFMRQVPEFEHMLVEDGVDLVKFWFSISRNVQAARFDSRRQNPLKQWKLSPLDERAQELWADYTRYKESMFARTHTSYSPWILVQANVKRLARLESMRYVLSQFEYDDRSEASTSLIPDPDIVTRFHRAALRVD